MRNQNTLTRYITTDIEPFFVIGIAVRTINQNGQAGKDIGELWQRLFNDNIINQIPNKINNDIYCVYTDYESDYQGAYTTLLGCKVSSLENIPEGFRAVTVPKGTYRLYQSKGKLPDSVIDTWKHIWQTPIHRRYVADFDVYGKKSKDPNNAEVETYLSIL
ncbi:MAG: AraC family transcriptional regulator [Flavisolibacter sp.]|nr:AraC family transcriptional regulator [Flavisolibacter sp.]